MAMTWTSSNPTWQALDPYQRAAAMSLMEADKANPEDARRAMGAMINRSAKEKQNLGTHVGTRAYQPSIEPAQEQRLPRMLAHPEFNNLTDWARRRAAGDLPDPVNGATHFLAHEPVMEKLQAREPQKYRSWVGWTGYNRNGGTYANPDGSEVIRDRSHAFLAPEGKGPLPPLGLLNLSDPSPSRDPYPSSTTTASIQPSGGRSFAPSPPQQGPTSMDPKEEQPTFLQDLSARFRNPLTQQGMGILAGAMQGNTLGGFQAGASAAETMQNSFMKELEMRRQQMQRAQMEKLLNDPNAFPGAPPNLVAIARAMKDVGPLAQFYTKHPEMELERQKMQAQTRMLDLKAAELEQGGKPKVMTDATGKVIRVGGDGATEILHDPDSVEARRKNAQAAGLDVNSPQTKVYLATGKMPREDQQPLTATDKKAILEADEAVNNNQGAINTLKEATELSKKAYTGPTAGVRGYVGSLLGLEGAVATENLTNAVMNNTLQNLKPIFGGNPTEGERKILIELQGSVNKSPEVRADIYRRALQMAERRLKFNEERANQLRGGTYYKQGGSPIAPPAVTTGMPTAPSGPQPPNLTIPSGKATAAPDAVAAPVVPAAPAAAPVSRPEPPQAAIEMLRKDTSLARRKQFDEIFGPGASDRALKGN